MRPLTEHRQFSVGAITTRPNDQLGPERLMGGELGLNVAPARNLTARLTWFDNRVKDPRVERHDDGHLAQLRDGVARV